jgi:fibronectin type 3 domain-containing protein
MANFGRAAFSLWSCVLAVLAASIMLSCGGGGYGGGTGGGNPPSAPTGLSATAGDKQVSLTWTASSGATTYNVKRATTSGSEKTIASASSASYTDLGLTDGTKYYYVVSAVNSYGESGNSSEANAAPVLAIPAVPTNLAATAGNAQVVLNWTASSGATSYNVKRATTSGAEATISSGTGAGYTDSTVSNGTKYYYVVTAVNTAGESASSSEVNATPNLAVPAVPTGLTATPSDKQVALAWTASAGAASYNVKRSTTSGSEVTISSPTSASYTDSSVSNGTKYYYEVSAVNAAGQSANSSEVNATPATLATDVTITIDPSQTKPISPWIYGINSYGGITGAPPKVTIDRAGGNRWTAYNWETNASNAGNDYIYDNDNYLSGSSVPAEAVRSIVAADQGAGIASVMTVQLQGLVSADENGPVSVTSPPDLTRFKTVVDKKSTVSSAPFTTTPPTSDANVYMDEFVWAMDQKLPGIFGASPALPSFVSLDNEPELWNSTHLEVQGATAVLSDTYIAKTISITKALKDQFPNVVIFGPVHYGFQGIYNWQGELSATPNGTNWFPDKYLPAIKSASDTYGKTLVDVYDFHWYPEEYDASSTRITSMSGTTLTDAQVQLIVQSPRNLWDPTYDDGSSGNSNPWIFNELGGSPIQILPRLQAKIAAEFPGMKGLSMTEYEGGGWNHIAGTIAQADMLGIFGNQGLFAANLWPPSGTYDYALAGFRVFRSFDGANANFGDTSLSTTSSNVQNVVVYASLDSTVAGRAVFVAINRSTSSQVTAINGLAISSTATVYQITASSAQGQSPVHPVKVGQMAVSGTSLTVTLPALSVSTIEVK